MAYASQLPGFQQQRIEVNGVELSVHVGGSGPPLMMLHGYPQNHMCWLNIAPSFARDFTCIVPDLRGYGDSDAPADDSSDHSTYSKRRMAEDAVGILDALGHRRAHILGHDRGGRVAYRFALDHPDRLDRLGIIEIVPTGDFWRAWGANLALKGYHWTFLAQPRPVPERMINADPVAYVDHTLKSWTNAKSLDIFPPSALESYRAQAQDPDRIHAMCADYRAVRISTAPWTRPTGTQGAASRPPCASSGRRGDSPGKPVTLRRCGGTGPTMSRTAPASAGIS